MLGRIARLLAVVAISLVVCGAAFAQRPVWPIDFEHSIAAFSLNSADKSAAPLYAGMAKVAGFVKLDSNDLTNSSFEFNIYPARQESRVLNPDGTFRVGSYADLSRYSRLMFQSKRVKLGPDGQLTFTGDLMAAHVEREGTSAWSIGYTGAQPIAPVEEFRTREVTFVLESPGSQLLQEERAGFLRLSALAIISREDFRDLW